MAAPLDLANLPRDIIRRIIGMSDESLDEISMISPSWNAEMTQYLADPQLGTLERVFIHSAIDNSSNVTTGRRHHSYDRAQMVAILPNRFAKTVGVGKWLHEHQTHTGDAVEVTCSPERIEFMNSRVPSGYSAFLQCMTIAFVLTVILVSHPIIWHYFVGTASVLALFAVRSRNEQDGEEVRHQLHMDMLASERRLAGDAPKHFPRMARFFDKFSHIETVALEEVRPWGQGFHHVVAAMRNSLGDVTIDRLELVENDIDEKLQNHIVELCRAHGIRRVIISTYTFRLKSFRSFVRQLTQMDVAVDILEKALMSSHLLYFSNTRLYWDKLAAELLEEQISLRITTVHDTANAPTRGTKAHIRCERVAAHTDLPLTSVDTKRGFKLR